MVGELLYVDGAGAYAAGKKHIYACI